MSTRSAGKKAAVWLTTAVGATSLAVTGLVSGALLASTPAKTASTTGTSSGSSSQGQGGSSAQPSSPTDSSSSSSSGTSVLPGQGGRFDGNSSGS